VVFLHGSFFNVVYALKAYTIKKYPNLLLFSQCTFTVATALTIKKRDLKSSFKIFKSNEKLSSFDQAIVVID